MGRAHNESTTRSSGLEGVACVMANIQSAENDVFLLYSVPQADLIAYPFLASECPFHHWLGLLHTHRRLPPPVHWYIEVCDNNALKPLNRAGAPLRHGLCAKARPSFDRSPGLTILCYSEVTTQYDSIHSELCHEFYFSQHLFPTQFGDFLADLQFEQKIYLEATSKLNTI